MIDELEDKQSEFFAEVAKTFVSLTGAAIIIFVPPIEPPAIIGGAKYAYECKNYGENASQAGTVEIASAELIKAVDCLGANHLTQSFEYEDLKANLDYTKKQPDKLIVLPDAIRNSIKQSSEHIKYRKNEPINKKTYILWFAIIFVLVRGFLEIALKSLES